MTEATPGSLRFPAALPVPTDSPEIQRMRAAVEAKLVGGDVDPVRVGRFVILERVGHGAMGVVYAAYDDELDRKVAIKLLRPAHDDGAERSRLLREAQAMARLSHPNVVGVFEIGQHGGAGFVAMEFVRGRTLRQWREDESRGQREILDRYQQAGSGLAAAHAAGVVHRDFKPDNALIGDDDRVRVADFGLAGTQADEGPSGVRMGTPGYMAPEQILGESTDARSDQFAFCVALWEALVGQRPFVGKTTNEVFDAVLAGAIRPPPRGVMPAWIEAVLRTGLATRAEERHPSMDALLRALATDPRRRRRRILAGAMLVSAVPATLAVLHMRGIVREEACATSAAVIDDLWNDDRELDVRAALASTGAPNATTMADKAIPSLTEYVDRWRTASAATCRAIEIDHALDPIAAERASACLSERLQGVGSLVDALAHADASIVDNAVQSVLQLPTPARCTDARSLALDLHPPTDPEELTELRRIEGEIAGAEALRRLGRAREALARLEAQAEPAAALDWPAIEARLQFRMGQLHTNLGAPERALELGQRAFLAAYRAGDDATAAMSASLLTHVLGVQLARNDEAQHWDDLADAALARTNGEQPQAELFHATTQGRRWLVAGDLEKSEAALQRAVVLGEQIYGPDHLFLGDPLLALANVQCRQEAHAACLATHERAYAILSAGLGDDHPWTARALAGLGLSVHHAGDSERALALLDAALAIDETHFGPDHLNVAVDLSYSGVVLQESGKAKPAVARLERGLAIMRHAYPPDHPEIVVMLANLGRAQQDAGDSVGARTSFEEALAIHARNGSPDASQIGDAKTRLADLVRESDAAKAAAR